MAIKTISLELDSYDLLVRARHSPRESFSSVVRRASWTDPQYTGRALMNFTGGRTRSGDVLNDESLSRLLTLHGGLKVSTSSSSSHDSDSYLLDIDFLILLELELKTRAEGPATAFLKSHESAVFGVSSITAGVFAGALAETDQILGFQILSRYDQAPVTDLVVKRYATEVSRARPTSGDTVMLDNDTWVGCTATALDRPLVTRNAARFQHVGGLKVVTL